MRILQVTNFFKPSWESGGPARACYEISKELVKRGHEVTVYTTDGFKYRLNVPKNKPIMVDGIKVYYFKNISSYLSRNFVLPIPYYLPFIARKEIKKFDIIHLHEYRTFLNIIVTHYARKYKIPHILQPRGSFPRFIKSKQKKIFDVLFGYRIINSANKIIATSRIEASQYNNKITKKIVYIPNGINLEDFKHLPKKGEFRKKYKIKENEKIILYLGRIHKRKGLDLLIDVFYELKKELKNVKLVIVGPDDGYLNYLKNQAKKIIEEIIFLGPLFERNKLEAYVDADIFVLPSKDKYESFGNVVLEALACGTPVIVTNNCGISEYITSEVGNIISYNKKQLTKTLYNLLINDRKRKQISKYAKKFVKNFSWKKVVDKIEIIYKSCKDQNNKD